MEIWNHILDFNAIHKDRICYYGVCIDTIHCNTIIIVLVVFILMFVCLQISLDNAMNLPWANFTHATFCLNPPAAFYMVCSLVLRVFH